MDLEVGAKRNNFTIEFIYRHAKFGNFWTWGRLWFVISKLEELKIFEKSIEIVKWAWLEQCRPPTLTLAQDPPGHRFSACAPKLTASCHPIAHHRISSPLDHIADCSDRSRHPHVRRSPCVLIPVPLSSQRWGKRHWPSSPFPISRRRVLRSTIVPNNGAAAPDAFSHRAGSSLSASHQAKDRLRSATPSRLLPPSAPPWSKAPLPSQVVCQPMDSRLVVRHGRIWPKVNNNDLYQFPNGFNSNQIQMILSFWKL
jgi:hypothetical protein